MAASFQRTVCETLLSDSPGPTSFDALISAESLCVLGLTAGGGTEASAICIGSARRS